MESNEILSHSHQDAVMQGDLTAAILSSVLGCLLRQISTCMLSGNT